MKTSSPFYRLVAVLGTVAALAIVTAAVILLPGGALTQADEPGAATPQPLQTRPPLQPSPIQVNPPAATPVPGAAGIGPAGQERSSDLEAVRFRPKVRLKKGQLPALPQNVDKPAVGGQDELAKPPGEEGYGPQEAYVSPNYEGLLGPQDWTIELYESFEEFSPPGLGVPFAPTYGTSAWRVYDYSEDGYERTWGASTWIVYPDSSDSFSAWPAAFGEHALDPNYWYYPNDLNSWMKYGPLDLSNMADVFVSFGLWYQTEPVFDWAYFCASIDDENYNCDYWSGDSGGWTDQAYWLTSYAGYSQVWFAWGFVSDFSNVDDGPFVDEIWIWGDEISAEPTPEPTLDPEGQLIENGSFEAEDHFAHWGRESRDLSGMGGSIEGQAGSPPPLRPDVGGHPVDLTSGEVGIASIGVVSATHVHGQWSAYLWQPDGQGEDFLYQLFEVPSDVADVVVNYWFGVTTEETVVGRDRYCASLRSAIDHDQIWVDLGCLDSTDASGHWQELVYALTDDEVEQVEGQRVALTFEMYNNGSAADWSAGWVDFVRVYATGGGGGAPLDPNEPNDSPGEATVISCGDTVAGVIGDALGGGDFDWFRLDSVPTGQIDLDIDARTQVPDPSALDSVVSLWDGNVHLLDWNDDDGISYDSYLTYTVESEGTFYVRVESYSGDGSADSFYDLTVQCAGEGSGPPPGGTEPTEPDADTWTVMLYLNAEDPGFADILTRYRTDIEAFIGSKDFLKVAILYDGPLGSSNAGTTRYLVQPNGAYTDGVNRWDRGELNMGHPDTLANFVTWAMDQYPAEHYYLAVDDHGDGAYGISYDRTSSNDQLIPPELYTALKSATQNGARKIDIFDYEACLMGLAENAYDLRQWVDYVVFFEQISWGLDTYPVYFHDLAASDEPEAVGRRIVDRYYQQAMAANGGRGYPHTISLIDTSQIEAVSDAVSAFGNKIKEVDTEAQKTAIKNARNGAQAFAADYDATNPLRAEYIDLYDLAAKASGLASAQAAAVRSAVDDAVVHERHASGKVSGYVWDHGGVHGLSIYYPPSKSSSAFAGYTAPTLYQMSHDGDWDEFLNWALPSGTRRGMSAFRSQDKFGGDVNAYAFKYVYLPVAVREK